VRQAERDAGNRPGLTTDERQPLKQLERENFELKRANEILRKASAFFAQAELAVAQRTERQGSLLIDSVRQYRTASTLAPSPEAGKRQRPFQNARSLKEPFAFGAERYAKSCTLATCEAGRTAR
jgi:hypothetical protein